MTKVVGRTAAALLSVWLVAFASAVCAEPLVVATTPDLKSIAEAEAGGGVRVESLVPAGTDPEAFEPRPSHLALMRGAALVVRIGLGLDDWVDPLRGPSRKLPLERGGPHKPQLSAPNA